jgi:hypothetical protein
MSEAAINEILDRARRNPDEDRGCDCCNDEESVGVASVPFVPMSIAWGRKCLEAAVVPLWVCFAQATSGIEGDAPTQEQLDKYGPLGREMFNEEWLGWHDRTLAHFEVTEGEFWAAVNAP